MNTANATEHAIQIEEYYRFTENVRNTQELIAEERTERRRRRKIEEKRTLKKSDSRPKRTKKQEVYAYYTNLINNSPEDEHLLKLRNKYGLPKKQGNKRGFKKTG